MFTISPAHNVVSWTSMISAYSVHGRCTSARECLKEMGKQGLIPADAAFTSLLSACSHAGNTEEGYNYLNLMKDQYGIQPSIEHYNCILQLLGQVGCLKEAEFVLQTMPIAADLCSWMTLLIACRCFGNIRVGQWSMNKATKLDPDIIAGNPLLSTMHVGIVTYGELCSIDDER
jgi:pentatricopeptide repeat protein